MWVVGLDVQLAFERRVGVAKADEVHQPPDHGSVEGGLDLVPR